MLLFLLFAASSVSAQVCTKTVTGTLPITLYSVGTYGKTNYTHVISSSNATQALFGTAFATTAQVEYNLDGLAVTGPSSDCSIDCLWSLNAFINSTSPSAVMARWGDSYPLLTNQTTWAPLYCAKSENYCGATIPLYLYFNGKHDYYVSNDGKGPSNSTAAYSLASVNNIMPGTPLCYVWPMPTTTSVSTTPFTGSTTTYTGSTTTYTGSTSSTTSYTGLTTTTTPFTGPTTTTTPYTGPTTKTTAYTGPTTTTTPYTGPSTTATVYTGSTTTTKPYTGPSTTTTPYTGPTTTTTPYTGPSTTKSADSSTSSSSSSGSGWWKWVLIGVGVVLIAGIIIGLLGLITVMFINPQPIKRNVVPYAPNSNVLPPQPVHAAPTPQPLTVGPTGGYPPM